MYKNSIYRQYFIIYKLNVYMFKIYRALPAYASAVVLYARIIKGKWDMCDVKQGNQPARYQLRN